MSPSRLVRHALVALLMMFGLVTVTTAPASAATGSITGTVVDTAGHGVGDYYVSVFRWDDMGSSWQSLPASTFTNDAGEYVLSDLDPGTYTLFYEDGFGERPGVWSNGTADMPETADSPGAFAVGDGEIVTRDPITVPDVADSDLQGRVEKADGTKLDGVLVEAYRDGAAGDADPVASDITYGGAYHLYVPAGDYHVTFSHLSGDYTDAVATVTAVKDDTVVLATQVLTPASSFTSAGGHVAATPSGASNVGQDVYLYRVIGTPGHDSFDYRMVGYTTTNASGNYSFTKLVPGKRYAVLVSTPGYTDRWLGDTEELTTAAIFSTTTPKTIDTINVARLTTISGHVADSAGNARGVEVEIYRWDSSNGYQWASSDATDTAGNYTAYLDQGGIFAVHAAVYDADATSTPGADRWFGTANGEAPTTGVGAGTYTVATGAVLANVSTTLTNATRIAGTVRDSAHPNGLADVDIFVSRWDGSTWVEDSYGRTLADGTYRVRPEGGTGDYTLQFYPPTNSPARSQFLGGTDTMPDGNALTPQNSVHITTVGQLVTGRNITLADSPVLTGQVVSGGAGVPNARMRAYRWDDTDGVFYRWSGAVADSTGHYRLKVDDGGTYTVRAARTGYYRSFLGGSNTLPTSHDGSNSVVADGASTPVGDITLEAVPITRGSLSGTVSGPGGPAEGVHVQACPVRGGTSCDSDTTSFDGTWSMTDLVTGDYTLDFWPADDSLFAGAATTTVVTNTDTPVDITLGAPAALPGGASVVQGGQTQSSGVPTVYYASPLVIRVPGAAGLANPTYTVRIDDGGPDLHGPMVWEASTGTYKASIPPFEPRHGNATITTNVPKPSSTDKVSFDIYIDPSGNVVDQFGQPVSGATAVLSRSETQGGTYTAVPNGDAIMSPSNRVNPMTTDANGAFHWDVTAGWYKVAATKDGCTGASTPAMQVPPEQVDLVIALSGCPMPMPTAAPTVTGAHSVGSVLTGHAGTWSGTWDAPSYQWKRNGAAIGGATGLTYRLTASDAGAKITLEQTQKRSSYAPVKATSAAFGVNRVSSTGAIRMYAAKIKRTQRGLALLTFKAAGIYPTGKVTALVDGGTYKAYGTMYAGNRGALRITLPKLKRGKHSVKAVYAGNVQVAPSGTATTYLTVK